MRDRVMMPALVLPVLMTFGCAKPIPTPANGGGGGSGPAGVLVPPVVPAELAVPAGVTLTFEAPARGVQIYECDPGGGNAWKLHAPRADLFDDAGAVVATHFGGADKGLPAGPYWQASDGSRVHGANPVSVAKPGAIPLLRLDAADTSGTGIFAKVAFVHRLDTTGGAAPSSACEPGKQVEVAYTAKYYFYSRP
jgi:hypothetical protein